MAESWPRWGRAADEHLMWRVKMDDDAKAFAALMDRWGKPIHSLCVRMTGDPGRAEDLCQDVFARLFARRKNYEPSGRFSTFLWRIALNICYDALRHSRRRPELPLDQFTGNDDETIPSDNPAPDVIAEGEERALAVRSALQQLAEPYRVVVVLRHYEGLKFREIADVLDLAEGTVKSRMAEALSQLGRKLAPAFNERDVLCNETKPRATLAI